MDRWTGRVALVTGASAGIGAAIAKDLVRKGMKVIGVARRLNKVQALESELKGAPGKLYPVACDISKEADIIKVFEWAKKHVGGVDVLINNAGLGDLAHLTSAKTDNWKKMWDINVLGLSICTREAIKSLQERGVNDGHIININSMLGHQIIDFPGIGMYSSTKFAVTALTQALRKELAALESRIKVTSLSPGEVRTEFASPNKNDPDFSLYDDRPHLLAQNVSDTVLYVLGTPENVQVGPEKSVTELTVGALGLTPKSVKDIVGLFEKIKS